MAGAIAAALSFPAAVNATVTIGSNLARTPDLAAAGGPTFSQGVLALDRQAQGGLTSPVNGTVVRWRIRAVSFTSATQFRVIRPLGGNLFTGAGTSAAMTPPASGSITPYDTQLPIRIGDSIGLHWASGENLGAFVGDPSAVLNRWFPALVDGGPGRPSEAPPAFEAALNADIEPTAAFTIDKTMAKKGGKVNVTATLPNAGSLTAGDARDASVAAAAAKRKKLLKSSSSQVSGPGQITLKLKPTKAAKEKLRSRGKLKATVKLAFTPTGGTAATDTAKVKLKA